jgi:hypothetical protein
MEPLETIPRNRFRVQIAGAQIHDGSKRKGQLASKSSAVMPSENAKRLDLDRAALRAITPAGFANAFFKANR